MAMGALPPNLLAIAIADFLWGEVPVLLRMPFGRKRRMCRGKVIDAGKDDPVCANRAAAAGGS